MFFSPFVFIKAHLPFFRTFVKEKCGMCLKKKKVYIKKKTHNTKRCMHLYVHSSIICNCQGMKQPMDSSIGGILLSHKKKEISSFVATWVT